MSFLAVSDVLSSTPVCQNIKSWIKIYLCPCIQINMNVSNCLTTSNVLPKIPWNDRSNDKKIIAVVVVIVCCIKDNLQSISWPLNICLKPLKELIKTCRTKFSYISFSAQKIASINYIKMAIKCLETSKAHLMPRLYFFILIKMETWQSLRILKT